MVSRRDARHDAREIHLPFRSLFLHAWDVADEGADTLMAWMADAGLNTMCFAGTYHSGWFVHPHAPQRHAYLTEGGGCYFQPQLSIYKGTARGRCNGINFYNRSEAPPKMLGWMTRVMRARA